MRTITEFVRLGLSDKLLKQLREESATEKVGVSELIRTAIEQFLLNQRKARLAELYSQKPTKWK